MKKIKLIFTGGTIMSTVNNDDININDNTKYELIERSGHSIDEFTISNPINKLSENFIYDDILKIYEEIIKSQKENVDEIIILHGTDTLAYTAPYIALLLQKCDKKVVFVSSNYTLSDNRANGIANFNTAIKIIRDDHFPNAVYVAYKNYNENFVGIHLATRLLETPAYSDCYNSPDGYRYAKYINNEFQFENTKYSTSNEKFSIKGHFDKKCLYITPYTGLNYQMLENVEFDFVVHGLYHSGTANNNLTDKKYNVVSFIDYCNKKNKPIFFCNLQKREAYYSSTNSIFQKNATFLYDTLPNVANAKVNIALNLIDENERDLYLKTNIAGEILK